MRKIIFILLYIHSFFGFSQKREIDSLPKKLEEYMIVKPADTITIVFDEIAIFPKPRFKSSEDVRYYLWFQSKVYKAYPYARLASERLDSLNNRLEKINSNSKKRKYIKLIQEYMEGEFTDQLKKMTKTEGRILIKLIHRQTGKTTYDNIKEYRSGWKAFWYNTTASLFKLSLKDEYHPAKSNEDFLIEDILQRAFQNGYLPAQPSKLTIDFPKIISDKKAEINVEEYKQMFAKMKKRK